MSTQMSLDLLFSERLMPLKNISMVSVDAHVLNLFSDSIPFKLKAHDLILFSTVKPLSIIHR